MFCVLLIVMVKDVVSCSIVTGTEKSAGQMSDMQVKQHEIKPSKNATGPYLEAIGFMSQRSNHTWWIQARQKDRSRRHKDSLTCQQFHGLFPHYYGQPPIDWPPCWRSNSRTRNILNNISDFYGGKVFTHTGRERIWMFLGGQDVILYIPLHGCNFSPFTPRTPFE